MDLIDLLQKNYGKKFKIKFRDKIPQGDIKKTFSNISMAKKLINFKPKTNLNNGIRKFVDWYKNYYFWEKWAKSIRIGTGTYF